MVDADVAKAIADGRIPDGVTAEYLDQTRDPPAIAAIIAITVVTTIFLCARFFSRIFLVKSFGYDDGLALFSYACFIAFVALCIILIQEGSGRHLEYIQYVLTESETDLTEVNDYAAHLIYTSALFICRLSGLAFFHRLCLRHQPLLRAIRVAAIFLVCAFLPQFFLILAHCTPVTGLWPYAWQPNAGNYSCVTWGTVYVTNSGLSLVCDFVVFSIPLAMISLLKLSKSRKVMLVFVLMPGVVVIGISITRLYLCVVGQWRADGSWYYDPQLAIEVAEVGGTLMTLSIPGLKPLLGLWYHKMKTTADSSASPTNNPDSKVLGYERQMSDAGLPQRKSQWHEPFSASAMKTSIDAGNATVKGSSRASDDDLLSSRDIMVQTDMDQRSIPLHSMDSYGRDMDKY
ncbi:hypothetical protein BDV97DRAFT_364935 [Delphinella strobiligena]|nr:hypothetical protein BDV97DRAFT_364935 [Delphinella strobiligena]